MLSATKRVFSTTGIKPFAAAPGFYQFAVRNYMPEAYKNATLNEEQKKIVQDTAPAVAENVLDITKTFYPIMFERYPEVATYFNQTHQQTGAQPRALANAVVAYATHLDKLGEISGPVNTIVHKHTALNVKPEQYPIVGECLLEAIGKVMGNAVNQEVMQAWEAAYNQLARILIEAEEAEYSRKENLPGGWRGGRTFQIADKVRESDEITSFYLKPKDGTIVMNFEPGQYLGLRLTANGQTTQRNYSLSAPAAKDTYRISVKKEDGGLVSSWLHDEAQVGTELTVFPPAGDFVLREGTNPVLFCTGGVGVTPALAMLEHIVQNNVNREINWIHAARNRSAQAFRTRVQELAQKHPNLRYQFILAEEESIDPSQNESKGLLTKEHVNGMVSSPGNVDSYVLGPKGFMQSAVSTLKDIGVPRDNINFEFFGPSNDIDA
eukprot:gb/GECG01011021.1/.p1 GENE.gb/GECG01011021.1/~~gb/GECG01011021.1/.p1  ORF type:complete len:436 (+),score=65.16 gb/GECG01011021.1/:1-1308(+)